MDKTITRTVLTTYVDGFPTAHGDDFEAAATQWCVDSATAGRSVPGGISIQQFNADDIMVRDGWLIHVHNDGTVYVHPRGLAVA